MGAGSAKGVTPDSDEDDRFSNGSDQWESDQPATEGTKKSIIKNSEGKGKGGGVVTDVQPTTSTTAALENGKATDKKKEVKKKTGFTFSRKADDNDRGGDESGNESSEDDKKNSNDKKVADKNKANRKDADKKGFRIFGWRKDDNSKKSEERDTALDEDIDDLEKTFDSLGIVGKNMWGSEGVGGDNKQSVDDLELLEPMRKRKNVRVRGPKGTNGTVGAGVSGANSGGSSGSKRTFKFSWETEGEKQPVKEQEDEWEYKAVVIEGFDIEKFRKANLKDSVFDSTSLPNAIAGDEPDPGASKSPLRYDQSEQLILASIERELTN